MKIVLTGATGLVGQHLLPALARAHDVWAISRSGQTTMQSGRVTWVRGDLAGAELPRNLPPDADVLIHLAQSAHYREFPERALDVFEVNVGSTARLLDWSLRTGVRHFILASSGGVDASTERSYYLASKACAERLAESYADRLTVLVLRFFFVYGSGQKPWMLVPRLIESIRAGRDVVIAGADGPRINPVHVSDAVRALEAAVAGGVGGRVDVAGGEVLTLREVCETIAVALGRSVRFAPDDQRRPADLVGDIAAMCAAWGPPRRSFAEGVAEMIAEQRP